MVSSLVMRTASILVKVCLRIHEGHIVLCWVVMWG